MSSFRQKWGRMLWQEYCRCKKRSIRAGNLDLLTSYLLKVLQTRAFVSTLDPSPVTRMKPNQRCPGSNPSSSASWVVEIRRGKVRPTAGLEPQEKPSSVRGEESRYN